MARIIIADLSYGLMYREISTPRLLEDISIWNLENISGGKNNDFYYLLNYMAAGLAIYSIRKIADWVD
jgi:hypothetical protein